MSKGLIKENIMNQLSTPLIAKKKILSPKIRILLTKREQTILNLISHEYSDKEIGKKLLLSHHTVHTHRKNLMSKLDVTKSTGLVRRGFELGYLKVR